MTRNRSYRAVPFPGFMQEIIRAEGLSDISEPGEQEEG